MSIDERYLQRTPGSHRWFTAAARVMPGGDTRLSDHHAPYRLTFVRGEGPRLWDVDGHEYLDLLSNFTSLVHGNAYPPVLEAAREAVTAGTAWAGRNEHQVRLAEHLVERVASVQRVRFTNSGTEAFLHALHVAKVVTGRSMILMARHGYHGTHEDSAAGTFAGAADLALWGGHDGQQHATLLAEFGDAEDFERVLRERGSQIAAVFLEPVQGSTGLRTAPPEFWERVRAATAAAGALLVLDEVVTLRLAEAGAQSRLGIEPDLTMMGKIIGGGFPIGAVGGRTEHLEVTSPPSPHLPHGGTFNGNPVSTAAGLVAMEHLTGQAIARMHDLTQRLETGLHEAAAAAGLAFSTRREGSLIVIFLEEQATPRPARVADPRLARLHLAAANHGLHYAARGLLVVSTAFDEHLVDEAIERFALAMQDVAAEVTAG
ncbi:MAG TPA: aminotransferase class III-fold pyridoxal phosphate-dependent enzyme [Nitriliruptorales bacterium]